jgi:hypothetical protein
MFTQSHQYDLTFVSSIERPGAAPEIVFTIKRKHLQELCDRMVKINYGTAEYVERYCEGESTFFNPPTFDMFGHGEFGYGNCGHCVVEDDKVELRLTLRNLWQRHCALTINVLLIALGSEFEAEHDSSNTLQLSRLMTNVDIDRRAGYGHDIGGYVSPKVTTWLSEYVHRTATSFDETGKPEPVSMHPEVLKAMRVAWTWTSPDHLQQYADECKGYIRSTGDFVLTCFGDATDCGTDIDQYVSVDEDSTVDIICHNLDSEYQQLTLLVGLSKLFELAY